VKAGEDEVKALLSKNPFDINAREEVTDLGQHLFGMTPIENFLPFALHLFTRSLFQSLRRPKISSLAFTRLHTLRKLPGA
jgi:hypothetical protein